MIDKSEIYVNEKNESEFFEVFYYDSNHIEFNDKWRVAIIDNVSGKPLFTAVECEDVDKAVLIKETINSVIKLARKHGKR